MMVDFINLVLSFESKNRELLSNPERIHRFLTELSMKDLLDEYKKYGNMTTNELITAKAGLSDLRQPLHHNRYL